MLPKGGMSKMIKKAQELQSQMEKAQGELNLIEIEGQAGGGMVTAKVNGHKELISLEIDPEILNFRPKPPRYRVLETLPKARCEQKSLASCQSWS